MAKIYVAGKELNRAKKVMDILRNRSHEITYDWTLKYSKDDFLKKAKKALRGVLDADILVYLWEPDQESARYEAGMAMGLGKKIIVSGKIDSFFFKLPNIHCVESNDQIIKLL